MEYNIDVVDCNAVWTRRTEDEDTVCLKHWYLPMSPHGVNPENHVNVFIAVKKIHILKQGNIFGSQMVISVSRYLD